MKKYIIVFALLCFYSCEDKHSSTDTIFKYTYHENNRVASLKMSSDEYASWIENDGFTKSQERLKVINDIYEVFPDNYDFIFLILGLFRKRSIR